MKAEELRKSILQLAIQGKLVAQCDGDEPASVLLDKIRAEKAQLIKDKKIKKDKNESVIYRGEDGSWYERVGKDVTCIDEVIPFDIPDSWEWSRLETVGITTTGTTPSTALNEYFGKDVPFIKPADIFNTKIIYDNEGLSIKGADVGRTIPANSLLMVCIGGSIGKCFYTDRIVSFNQQINAISPIKVDYKYLFYVLTSFYFFKQIKKKSSGTATEIINKSLWGSILIPLPPLAEQKRIVEKLAELEPLLVEYDGKEKELSEINNKLPEELKKSILQYAIQGKLVEQDLTDEPASILLERIRTEKEQLIKEKKIKRDKNDSVIYRDEDGSWYERKGKEVTCIDEAIPFEIPDSWCWCRLGNLMNKITSGSTPTGGKNVYVDNGVRFLRSQNVYNDGLRLDNVAYITEEIHRKKANSHVSPNDILLNITGASIGRCAIAPLNIGNANINQHILILRLNRLELIQFIHLLITSPFVYRQIMSLQVGGTKEGLSAEKASKLLLPIPPLEEQKRIISKVKQFIDLIK